jgi:hypothetical protein
MSMIACHVPPTFSIIDERLSVKLYPCIDEYPVPFKGAVRTQTVVLGRR